MSHRDSTTPERCSGGARRVFSTIGKVLGTMLLVFFLTALVFTCLFALYVKNDLSQQVDFSIEGFSLDQTSVIYYEDPKTGQDGSFASPAGANRCQAGGKRRWLFGLLRDRFAEKKDQNCVMMNFFWK